MKEKIKDFGNFLLQFFSNFFANTQYHLSHRHLSISEKKNSNKARKRTQNNHFVATAKRRKMAAMTGWQELASSLQTAASHILQTMRSCICFIEEFELYNSSSLFLISAFLLILFFQFVLLQLQNCFKKPHFYQDYSCGFFV